MRRVSGCPQCRRRDGSTGLSEGTPEQAALKRLMVDNSHQIYVLADSTKLGLETSHSWTQVDRPWHLVTDDGATDAQLRPFRDLGNVEIHTARVV